MNLLFERALRNSDISLVIGIFAILLVLFTPIPAWMLDFLIICNFSFALLLLLLTFYSGKPTEFSTFPSMLLIATLFRLSLNVAATRLILGEADAGQVIGAIGQYVVGGNYVIGLIVFLILVVVQYVVVTAGAQRVAEVAARFTLDSMPGRQMSIDADLNMGFIDQDTAQSRRKALEKEASFYGAMDGASKFVKGDAIAGLIILVIDVLGGFAIGVLQKNMPWHEALQHFTLLTIGDGIVTQLPALVIAIGTGILVTRSASDGRLSNEILAQLAAYPRTLVLVGVVLLALMFLPGIPAWPSLILLSGLAVLVPLTLHRRQQLALQAGNPAQPEAADIYQKMAARPLEVGMGNAVLGHPGWGDLLKLQFASLRQQLALETGLVLPEVTVSPQPDMGDAHSYDIRVQGATLGQGLLYPQRVLAIAPDQQPVALPGIVVAEPAYGLPAVWIQADQADIAKAQGYTLAEPMTVFITHFSHVLRTALPQLLTRAETERLVNRARLAQPSLVDELVPGVLALSDVQRVLQGLLQEQVPIRNIEQILEVLVDQGRLQKDIPVLIDHVRQRLAAQIYQSLLGKATELQVITLDPATELAVGTAIRNSSQNSGLILEPQLAEQLVLKLSRYAEKIMVAGQSPVLVCQPDMRRGLRAFLQRVIPHLAVVAITELPAMAKVVSHGVIRAVP